jgi:hypothetical protein
MLALNAAYEHTFCKPAEAHVTLCVLTLPDALSVDAAAAALRATPPRRMCAIRLVGADVQTAKDVPRRATAAGWRA